MTKQAQSYGLDMETYASVSGMTMTMREISFGVTEADVTCDPSKFPGVKIIRK